MSVPNWGEELRDELVCPICLEPFKDPVNLDCGHNYCQACITKCWEASGTGLCPQCRKSLPGGELRRNKSLEEAVKIARGLDGECEKHEEVFSLFCKQDRTLICMVCRESRAHRDHTVIPIAAAAEECKEQLLSHLSRFQRVKEEQGRWAAAEKGKYQTLLEQIQRQKQEILSEFKQGHQILKQGEQLLCNCLEGTIQDLVKTRNKNTNRRSEGHLLLDNLLAEINQKCQQPEIELLKDIDSTLSRCEQVKGEEEAPVDSLTELESRVQALLESQKVLHDLLNFRVELGPLENLSAAVKIQVSCEDPTEEVPNNPEQDDTSLCLLDCEEGKLSSASCEEQEVVPTDGQNDLTDFINVEPKEARGHWFNSKVRRCDAWKIVAAVEATVLAVLLIVVIAWSVSKARVTPPDRPAACCPEKWIGYHGKCYFFSDDEADWTSSQHFCSSHGASLAWLDTLQEKDFLMRHKGNLDPWIGVRKELGQPWKWTNGSAFSDLFQIGGGGDCAYIYEITVSSSTCDTKRNWICSKPDEFAKREIS